MRLSLLLLIVVALLHRALGAPVSMGCGCSSAALAASRPTPGLGRPAVCAARNLDLDRAALMERMARDLPRPADPSQQLVLFPRPGGTAGAGCGPGAVRIGTAEAPYMHVDGEFPPRCVVIPPDVDTVGPWPGRLPAGDSMATNPRPLYVQAGEVTAAAFAHFSLASGYVSTRERDPHPDRGGFVWEGLLSQPGHSPAHWAHDAALLQSSVPWWRLVDRAFWHSPEGEDSSLLDGPLGRRVDHPVTHVSLEDAAAFCHFYGMRLPTEIEWEWAARAARHAPERRRRLAPPGPASPGDAPPWQFPWAAAFDWPTGTPRANVWRGDFPGNNVDLSEAGLVSGGDGWPGTAPTGAFPAQVPAPFPEHTLRPAGGPASAPVAGLFNLIGNVWEWTATSRQGQPAGGAVLEEFVLKGGSYMCHPSFCHRARIGARSFAFGQLPGPMAVEDTEQLATATGNLGFRCVADRPPPGYVPV
ncbi:hypothetical protein H696_04391 [Fonticula alba]|uniref:Sulfatase-modifying factor enzyme-like domain-containing protein n=1 Tax=Fonticula alba TaxID=691883 RepID=A0A058Z4E6_FONAL|nr:hypothetical protein H696_04391 [Fonticula alba]KCV68971.1 hypothetical protein H696_04391 [Fonticula alba]|eukprot:XP_009496542.1 hypothetical protein H696_04391 [Fonticula alba]